MDFNKQVDQLQDRVEELRTSGRPPPMRTTSSSRSGSIRPRPIRTGRWPRPISKPTPPPRRSSRRGSRRAPRRRAAWSFKAKAKHRADQVDADFAASDADLAEADAYAAIDYADWAVENARVAILDAIDARVTADEKSAAIV